MKISRKAAIAKTHVMAVMFSGLITAAIIMSNLRQTSNTQLVQIGVGPEDENDAMIAAALGESMQNSTTDISDDAKSAADDAINKTAAAAAAEIEAALAKGEADGQGLCAADLIRVTRNEKIKAHTRL